MPAPVTQDARVNAKRTANALDRLEQVEKTLTNVVSAVNGTVGNINQQLTSQGEVLQAVVTMLGRDAVEKTIKDAREAAATASMEAEKRALEELRLRGDVVTMEFVTDKAIIVGREYMPDGTVRHPGRAQVAFQRVDPQFQPKLLGQVVGFLMELPNGGKFEIVEVLQVVEKDEEVAPPAGELASAPTAESAT